MQDPQGRTDFKSLRRFAEQLKLHYEPVALKDLISEYRVIEVGAFETENVPARHEDDVGTGANGTGEDNCMFVRKYIVELDFADLEKAAKHFPFLAYYTKESGGLETDSGRIMAKIGNFMTGANIDNQDTVNTWIGSGASFKSKLGHGINTAVRL